MARKTALQDTSPSSTPMLSPHKMELLFTVVNREKTEFYVDILQSFEVNMQLILSAKGTAASHTLAMLGLNDNEKSVIISVIKKKRVKEAMSMLDEKFRTVKGGKGIAYTVPLTSTIGVAIYQFLSNTAS
jgi:hypothetical protein